MRSHILAAALGVLLTALAAGAQTPDTVLLEELTWTEVRDAIRAGKTTIIIPVGGTEQNGPHMALGKHNVRVRLLAERIARALGQTLVAPVVAYVPEGQIEPPTSHMRFPGTVTVPEGIFEATLSALAKSFRQHGFVHIVMLGEHGGYQRTLQHVQAELNRQWAVTPVRAHAIAAYYQSAQVAFAAELQRRGYTREEIGSHAGLLDTSLSLALAPALVRSEQLHDGSRLTAADGVYGDPHGASAELGRVGVEIIVRETVAAIRQATKRP